MRKSSLPEFKQNPRESWSEAWARWLYQTRKQIVAQMPDGEEKKAAEARTRELWPDWEDGS